MTKYFSEVVPLQKIVQGFTKNIKHYFSGINSVLFLLALRERFRFLSNRVIILYPCATLENNITKVELHYSQGDRNKSCKILGFN